MADIPGLIEGAHQGTGLGHEFLRHVERCRVLAHLVDLSSEASITERVDTIRGELEAYETPLDDRPWLLVGTKTDSLTDRRASEAELAAAAAEHVVTNCTISAVTGDGINHLLGLLFEFVARDEERA